ncbi:hypothetical protein SAMN02745671_00155 [Anaerovibrio lipolyticus DSM 3074]|uniref:Zinc-ribbon domain-containing protein n=2 Tax=Anaerovibrio lipolyticus TaxID=82374 RepID=A0A0B2JHI0_9FIRM|nr:zinc ribbon domain-containing protein [Anaerovibrio lipolyticus]KHM47264.1 hypothetical protein NZ47_13645 [Anaerovibrio lipolyticus]SHI30169.1 hypothetical protein SAMN02745671_00155 [Anaerovibrio lipolyticus DSM 3074]
MSKICTKCGKSFADSFNFCESCGSPLVELIDNPPPSENQSSLQSVSPEAVEQDVRNPMVVLFVIGFLIYWGGYSLSHYIGGSIASIVFAILMFILLGVPIFSGMKTFLQPKIGKFSAFGISLTIIYVFLWKEYPWLIVFEMLEKFIYPTKFIISEIIRMLCFVPTALLWAFCVNISMQNAKNSQY